MASDIEIVRHYIEAGRPDQMTTAFVEFRNATDALDRIEARAPEQGGEMWEFLKWLDGRLGPELNTSNYSHDDVCELNANVTEAVLAIRSILAKESAEPTKERQ